ncbi:MAG: hypothetical protein A2020_06780 [Lentisphaerae bacterium GWF2_45_14]|nr:MAG: hypothetical protein A2020_06780 [Lentisphaerae bacterium GWF2_45_14]
MPNPCSLGVDVGGTKIYAAVVDANNNIAGKAKTRVELSGNPQAIASQVKVAADEALRVCGMRLEDINDIGIALPSSIDPVTGDCVHAPNLGLKNFSVKEHFKKLFGRDDIFLGNDGNCGILGEYYFGAARGFKSAAGYFVGTGLGGGIIINGKLLTGNGGIAGELGHATIKYNGAKCGCGKRGCIEAYASKTGFVRALKKEILGKSLDSELAGLIDRKTMNIPSKQLAKAYEKGDRAVRLILDKGMMKLGAAAASLSAVIAPDCIVFGGGVMESMGEALMPAVLMGFRENLFGISPEKIELRLSELMDFAVACGATVLARKKGIV